MASRDDRSHYAQGCSTKRPGVVGVRISSFSVVRSEPNLTRRFYHSGETTDAAFVLDRISRQHRTSLLALAGVFAWRNVFSNCWASEAQTFAAIEGCCGDFGPL